MDRLSYKLIADVIASATDAEGRFAAAELASAYYAIEPPLETTRERMVFLRKALGAAATLKGG
jgi:hypothetical protein